MEILNQIRHHFSPSQPSVSVSNKSVSYREHIPRTELQPFIYCYWQLKTTCALDNPYQYRVVSDGCIDIFFNTAKPDESFVMGLSNDFTMFDLGHEFNYIGIRFLPSIFSQLFDVDASILTNTYMPLADLNKDMAYHISSSTHSGVTLHQLAELFDHHFYNKISNLSLDLDMRFYEALLAIVKSHGCVEIKNIKTGLSERQLRNIFKYFIGESPKKFSKIVRFQHLLKSKPSLKSLRNNKIFYESGYFDQSHFIRDFKKLYGLSPSRAIE